jgi:septal ring-binding cell division protein DamX
MNFLKIIPIILSIITIAGCTTTTTKLTQTEPLINQPAQYAKARDAFNRKDYLQAAMLLKPLAEQGNADAQYALGYMYHNGLGVPRNYKLALQWMSAASAKGNKKATEALHRISTLNSETTNSDLLKEEEQQPTKATTPDSAESKTSQPAKLPESLNAPMPTESPEASKEVASQETQPTLTADEKWIMDQPDSHFTIQLMAGSSEAALQKFIKDNNLHDSAVYYRTRRHGKDWFTLIQGSFESFKQVNEALKELPPQLQAAKPWPKSIGDIKELLSTR